MNNPLGIGMKVVSFCHYLQGPACCQYLADMGADVIKIEPLQGAFERHWSGGNSWVTDVSAFSLAVNRNKRSIALDLKSPEGLELARQLIAEADVVVENYRPGVLERLGLGYEAVRELNPAIIYASASGLGATGPAASRPGQDLLMQARSGLVAATGGGERGQRVVGAAVVDQHGGSLLAMGVLGAYVRRLQTGQGTRIESSLFSAAIDLQVEALTKYYAAPGRETLLERGPNVGSWYHDAPYGLYHLKDAAIVLSMNDARKLAAALDNADLQAIESIDRYRERDRYAMVMANVLSGYFFAELSARFDEHAIWYERVQSYEDLRTDPQANHNGVFEDAVVNGKTVTLVTHPLRYDGAAPGVRTMPLYAGSDSEDIMTELGLPAGRQAELIERGVVGVPRTSAAA
ncbi:CaiB/BaiF CoA-transferase family protein [Mesorhizobium sp. YR577]|uniref:CaiB/BaiF CoA transferase family protein n=1 Tax=Mesorhizobium sp. YR577 TaxID=1884373 RepID=UPI0008E37919|nr:CaiB/BaiF CoA-transferase family protein [Mesorhizobium sp. YR577]SFT55926.1 Crotonobetainyl-CoA:carnitine CoA-transferase CaiB [Mesorhizobium sp. YR577]